ncbi:hypothetical protein H8E52_08955 [bacterium]|nr:hypothetical protein [bacterium]
MRRLILLPLVALLIPQFAMSAETQLSWSTLRTLYRPHGGPLFSQPAHYDYLEIRPLDSAFRVILMNVPQALLDDLPGHTPVLLDAGLPIRLGPVKLPLGEVMLWLMGSESLVPPDADSRQSTPTDWSCLRICLAGRNSGDCIKRCGKDEG